MALSAKTIWEVRGQTGSDTNGGGFVAGASGTDFSQQAAAQITYTDLVAATTTTITSAANPFGATSVGNILNITSGTGWTAGRYQIVSVAGTTATVDRAIATLSSTGGNGKLGGCLATIQKGIDSVTVNDMAVYVKADGTYNITAALSIVGPSGATGHTRLIGYSTSRGDLGQVAVATGTANPAVNGVTTGTSATGWWIENFDFNGAASTGLQGLIGISIGNSGPVNLFNCRSRNFANEGIKTLSGVLVDRCEVTGCAGTNGALDIGNQLVTISDCYIHDNTKTAIYRPAGGGSLIWRNIIANNTGASSRGLDISAYNNVVGNVFYANGSDGILINNSPTQAQAFIRNNIFAKNGGYGINGIAPNGTTDYALIDYNAFWNNTTAPMHFITQGVHDVVLSGTDPTNDPFTAKGSGDWSLNNTTGAGASLRAAGFPGALPQLTPVGKIDIGPYQHVDPVRLLVHPGMTGGMRS